MNIKTVAVGVVLIALAGVLAFKWWPSDERAIRKQWALIEEVASKPQEEHPVDALVKATRLAGLFSDPCRLTVESVQHSGSYPRKQIQDQIVLVRSFYSRVEVTLHDLGIELHDNNTAVVRGTLRVQGQTKGEAIADAQELRTEMAKIDGQWLLTAVTLVAVLER